MALALGAFAALLLIWGAYPMVIGALAWLQGPLRQRAATRSRPRVSVVIATRDDAGAIRRRVADCRLACYPGGSIEVIVALDSAAAMDRSTLAFGRDEGVRIVFSGLPGGKAAALNAGVLASRGDILVFTDTAQRFEPDTIAQLVAALDDPALGAVSGRLELPHSAGPSLVERYWRLERWLRAREARLHSCIGVTGAVWAMRRSLWAPLPAGLILDDVFTPMRLILAGHRIGFAEGARAVETRTSPAGQEYRRKVRTLTGVLQLCAWMPSVLSPTRNPVWGQFVAHKLLRLLTPYLLLAIAAGALLEIAGAIGVAGTIAIAAIPAVIACIPRPSGLPRVLREALLMQTATVVAAANGVTGRWDVWSATPGAGSVTAAASVIPGSTSDGRLSPNP